jgi:hypothetical protein
MTSRDSVRMKVGYEDVSTRRANPAKLFIGLERIGEVTNYETAPNHIETVGFKRHIPDVSNDYIAGESGGEHFGTQVKSDCIRNILDAPPDATACVQQVLVW